MLVCHSKSHGGDGSEAGEAQTGSLIAGSGRGARRLRGWGGRVRSRGRRSGRRERGLASARAGRRSWAVTVPVVAVGLTADRVGRARRETAGAGGVGVLLFVVIMLMVVVVLIMSSRGSGDDNAGGCDNVGRGGDSASCGGGHARTFAVPKTLVQCHDAKARHRAHEDGHAGCRNLPVIAMRLTADRLGRGRAGVLGLTQRGGNEAQEGDGICNGLHDVCEMRSRVVQRVGAGHNIQWGREHDLWLREAGGKSRDPWVLGCVTPAKGQK